MGFDREVVVVFGSRVTKGQVDVERLDSSSGA
jgi:hypothetical protein